MTRSLSWILWHEVFIWCKCFFAAQLLAAMATSCNENSSKGLRIHWKGSEHSSDSTRLRLEWIVNTWYHDVWWTWTFLMNSHWSVHSISCSCSWCFDEHEVTSDQEISHRCRVHFCTLCLIGLKFQAFRAGNRARVAGRKVWTVSCRDLNCESQMREDPVSSDKQPKYLTVTLDQIGFLTSTDNWHIVRPSYLIAKGSCWQAVESWRHGKCMEWMWFLWRNHAAMIRSHQLEAAVGQEVCQLRIVFFFSISKSFLT